MIVSEVIKALSRMPQEAEVMGLYDGALRLSVDAVYQSRSGYVALAAFHEPIYHDMDRPISAPSVAENRFWLLTAESMTGDES